MRSYVASPRSSHAFSGHQVNVEFCSKLRKTATAMPKVLETLLKWKYLIHVSLNGLNILRGHEDLEGNPRSWWPSTAWNPTTVAKVGELGAKDRLMTQNMMGDQLHINWEMICRIVYEDLWKRKMCTKFVTQSHRWAQWSASWWSVVWWKLVTHLIHLTLSQPTFFCSL